jgi:ATP-dependent DNA helicase RecQ
MSKTTGINQLIDDTYSKHFANVGKGLYPIQKAVIHPVLEGHNTLALMPTGSGKSLCYWVAGKALGGVTLVVFPLTALMDEQAQKLRKQGCTVFVLHSGINTREQFNELVDLYNQERAPDFIFLSPERMATDGFVEFVARHIRDKIKLVVIDEVHCISQWGLDFRPFYKEIPYFLKAIFGENPFPTILGLTATLNPRDKEQICADFDIKEEHVIQSEMLLRHKIKIKVVKVPDEDTKDEEFWKLLEKHRDEKMLVYVDRRSGKRSTEELCAEALRRKFRAAYFHGELSVDEKSDIVARFRSGDLSIVFATNAFGMGIDIPDIRGVVHYLLPESTEQYYQQIGRVGRDGKAAWATLFYSDKNVDVRKKWFIEKSFPREEDIQKAFKVLSNHTIGHKTVNYFEEAEATQSAYHYLVRSKVIQPVCKAVQLLDCFTVAKNTSLPEYDAYLAATKKGLLINVAKKTGKPEAVVMADFYQWLADKKIKATRAPGKCLVVESFAEELPQALMDEILLDIQAKKQYRHANFDEFVQLLDAYQNSFDFHQAIGKYLGIDKYRGKHNHKTLSGDWVISKSEVIIANLLFERGIPFRYEELLYAPDGSCYLPDFTITWKNKTYYWEHLGMLDVESYERDWREKKKWYEKHFAGRLITTEESSTLSDDSVALIMKHFT